MNTDELVAHVISAATAVYTNLGAGYDESVYEEAMSVEFRSRGIAYEVERNTEIFYKGEKVGVHRLDFLLAGRLVVELKAVASISKSHLSQLQSYMRTLGVEHGMVVNFAYPDKDEPDVELFPVTLAIET
jgi:GxxExxY protein